MGTSASATGSANSASSAAESGAASAGATSSVPFVSVSFVSIAAEGGSPSVSLTGGATAGGGASFKNSDCICSNERPSADAGGGGGSTLRASSATVRCRSGSFFASASAARYCASASASSPRRSWISATPRIAARFSGALLRTVVSSVRPASSSFSSMSARPSVTRAERYPG